MRGRLRRRLIRRGVTVTAGFLAAEFAGRVTAAVPTPLLHSTLRIALGFTAGNTAAILRGVLNSMLLNQLRVATVVLLLGVAGSYCGWHAVAAGVGRQDQDPAGQHSRDTAVHAVPAGPENRQTASAAGEPAVERNQPAGRDGLRRVGQPSFIQASERTSICLKSTVGIEKLIADLGDRVKKGDVLALLSVPDLVLEGYEAKEAAVRHNQRRVELEHAVVKVTESDVAVAKARLAEAKALFAKAQAEFERWEIECTRLKREVDGGVLDPRVLDESLAHRKASSAAKDAAGATIEKAEAELAKQNELAKLQVQLKSAERTLAASRRDHERQCAAVGLLPLIAPYDGVIVARNPRSSDRSDTTAGPLPIYVIDKTDVVHVTIDLEDKDADAVHVGTRANVAVKANGNEPISGTVTRTSWAINDKRRVLRVEIDLPNPDGKLKPGMYAYVTVILSEEPGHRDQSAPERVPAEDAPR